MKAKLSILVADDDVAHGRMLRTLLENWGYAVDVAGDGAEAVRACRERSFDLVLLDVRMPVMDGLEALQRIREARPALPVLMMTAYSDVPAAVEAIKSGAFDYLAKPLDFERLRVSLRNVFAHADLVEENAALSRRLAEGSARGGILGQSAPMRALWEMIRTIAPSEATVLVAGESGTGKELAAKAVHDLSRRASGPFVAVNCGALTETLLASELFGHEKGAFTGADRRHDGLFVRARGGTLFLDEIGEMPLQLQAKLLRALQQGEIQRVGSDTPITVDVRVIAATNRDLRQEVQAKRFREDLYFRLNVISLEVPPLRRRGEDIPLLAAYFLQRFAERNRKSIKGFSPQALDSLLRYPWPGNVRELENAVERAVILCNGDLVTGAELPDDIAHAAPPEEGPAQQEALSLAGMALELVERRAIEDTMRQTGDNKSEAARRLGITRATLHNKLRKYGLEQE